MGFLASELSFIIFSVVCTQFHEYCWPTCLAPEILVAGFKVDMEAPEDYKKDPRESSCACKTLPSRSKAPICAQILIGIKIN